MQNLSCNTARAFHALRWLPLEIETREFDVELSTGIRAAWRYANFLLGRNQTIREELIIDVFSVSRHLYGYLKIGHSRHMASLRCLDLAGRFSAEKN